MSTNYLGPYPNVAVTVSIQVNGGPVVTETVNVPDTLVFQVTQQAALTQAPTDLRTAQRSLGFTTDPRLEVREADYPGYTVEIIERVIQQETTTDSWSVMEPAATALAGTRVRFRARAQVYDAAGAVYEAPVDLFSAPLTVVAHAAPGAMTAGAVVFDAAFSSQNGTAAQATYSVAPTVGSSSLAGLQYRLVGGATWSSTVTVTPGNKFSLTLTANTANQQIEARAVDIDGGIGAATTQTSLATTQSGGPSATISLNFPSGITPAGVVCTLNVSGFDVPADQAHELIEAYWDLDDDGHFDVSMGTTALPRHPHHQKWLVDGVEVVVRGPKVYNIATGALIETSTTAPAVPTGTSKTYLGIYKGFRTGLHCAHPYTEPGAKTIRAWVNTRDRIVAGLPWVAAPPVTFTALSLEESVTRRICVGTVTGQEPPWMTARYDTYEQCITAERNKSATIAILFANGQFHETNTAQTWGNTTPEKSVFGTYGTGTKAHLSAIPKHPAPEGRTGKEWVDYGWRYIANYDPRLPYGSLDYGGKGRVIKSPPTSRHTVYGLDIRCSNGNLQLYSGNDYACNNVVAANNWLSHHFDYDFYGGSGPTFLGFLANHCENPEGTYTGDWGESNKTPFPNQLPYVADHGSLRINSLNESCTLFANYLIPRNTWGEDGVQPAIRQDGDGGGGFSRHNGVITSYNFCYNLVGLAAKTFGGTLWASKMIVENNVIVIPLLSNGNVFKYGASGLTHRNNLYIIPDTANLKDPHTVSVYIGNGTGPDDKPTDPDMALYGVSEYNNTVIDQRPTNDMARTLDMDKALWAYFDMHNNVIDAPNKVMAIDTGDGPLDTTPVGDLGIKWHMLNNGFGDFTIPLAQMHSGHPLTPTAAGAATSGRVGVFDGWGNIRPINTVRGWSHA